MNVLTSMCEGWVLVNCPLKAKHWVRQVQMVASSSKWQQKEKYLHFSPSKERTGKEQFSQDTPLFSWQQELCCWDCLQSHVTNTPASPVWSPRCKYCFSQKSQCSLAVFCEHQTPSAPYPSKSSGYCCSIGPQKLYSKVVKSGICLEFANQSQSFPPAAPYSSDTPSVVMDVIL